MCPGATTGQMMIDVEAWRPIYSHAEGMLSAGSVTGS